jgi:SAM-dependent methyltransferase
MEKETSRITREGIVHHTLSPDEFAMLRYMDARLYAESATGRFTSWHSSFAPDHPDWQFRVEAQSALAACTRDALRANRALWDQQPEIRVVFLGASLGSIATYFHLRWLKALGLAGKLKVTILDLLEEPLAMTKRGEFEFAEEFGAAEYKRMLALSGTCVGNITAVPLADDSVDVAVAPFVHHHLNIYDKPVACRELARIVRPGGIISVGDLHFDCASFNVWLSKHVGEKQPYALESFVSATEHRAFFGEAPVLAEQAGNSYYGFSLAAP